jgi:hypothetical protein
VVGGVTLAATLWVLWRLRHRVAVGSLMLAGVGYVGLVGAFWTWAR